MFVSDLVFLVLELACAAGHCVGMIYPNWWYVSEPFGNYNQTKTSYFGLWETVTCVDNTCSSTKSDMDGKRGNFFYIFVCLFVCPMLTISFWPLNCFSGKFCLQTFRIYMQFCIYFFCYSFFSMPFLNVLKSNPNFPNDGRSINCTDKTKFVEIADLVFRVLKGQ